MTDQMCDDTDYGDITSQDDLGAILEDINDAIIESEE